jgi:hypothetical protein
VVHAARPRLAVAAGIDQTAHVDLDEQIHRYFGTSDLASVPPQA